MRMIKIKTAADLRKEISALLSEKTIKVLTERSYNYRTRDGPIEEIEHFISQFHCRMSSSIYARLEYLLKKGYRIENLETMVRAAENEKESIVKWAENESKRLWPKWKKIKRETENEKRREKRESPAAA